MAKREGRPPKAIKQEKFLGFFVTEKQDFIIRQKAKESGLTMSDYLRQVAIFAKVEPRWREGDQELLRELVAMSNDLHQLVEVARQEGALNVMLYFKAQRDKIDGLLKQLSHDE
jgi:hypothetical protein